MKRALPLLLGMGLCLILIGLLAPQPAEAGIFDADSEVTYKEYWVPHSEFSGGCSPVKYNNWYVEPGYTAIGGACPKTLYLNIPDDPSGAVKAEIFLDLWRAYETHAAYFRINGLGDTYHADVGHDWSRSPYTGEIDKTLLVQGNNFITFTGDRPYHVHDIAIRLYYDAASPLTSPPGGDTEPPEGHLVSIQGDPGSTAITTMNGGDLFVDQDKITLTAQATGAAYVEFHAYYDGYDMDVDGETLDWQNLSRNNFWPGGKPTEDASPPKIGGGTINHPGTAKPDPQTGIATVTWNMPHVINQSGVKFKIRVVDEAGNVREAAGGVWGPFKLIRNSPVIYFTLPDFYDYGLHLGGRLDTVYYDFNLPADLNLGAFSQAYLVGNYWLKPLFRINDMGPTSVHDKADPWELAVKEFNKSVLKNGLNRITYDYKSPREGQFVEYPGPMIVLKRTGLPEDVTPPNIKTRSPQADDTNVDIRQPIVVHLNDFGSGVDRHTILMTVNDGTPKAVQPTISGNSMDLVATYVPVTPYPTEESIQVTVYGCDIKGNCMTSADSFSFETEAPDVTPPTISNVAVTTTDTSAKISWTTDETAVGNVLYGLTDAYELGSLPADTPGTSQSILIPGLSVETAYHYKIMATDLDGNPADTGDLAFKTKRLPGAVQSDDFSDCTLNDEIWTYYDPIGDSTLTLGGETLQLGVPGGVEHNIWRAGINAPRIMQLVDDRDFTVIVKLNSTLDKKTQMQGILAQQDANNYLRFNVQHDGSDPSLAVVNGNDGSPQLISVWPLFSNPSYLRLTRQLSSWAFDYSSDGINWLAGPVVTKTLTTTQLGLFVGNTTSNPAHTVDFDYFFNAAAPIVPEDPARTLTINVEGVGTAIKSPDKATYNCNESINLTATPVTDWDFVGWSGDLTSANPTEVFQITKSSVVTATFENNSTYTLDVTPEFVGGGVADIGGTIEVDPDPVQTDFKYNDEIDLTATPELGWSFTGWSGDLTSTSPEETFVITKNSTITGTFTKDAYTLTVELVNEGVGIGGTVVKTPDQATYEYGEQVTLEATANPGWDFVGWEGDLTGTDPQMTITMTANTIAGAHFRQEQHDLDIEIISNAAPFGSGPGGAVLKDPDQITYGYGQTVTLTASVFGGWIFDGWAGALSGDAITQTLVITDDTSITATFTQETYELNVTAVGPGMVEIDPVEDEYFFGDIVKLTAVPESVLYDFAGWSGDLAGSGNPAVFAIEKDTNITATFVLDTTPIEIVDQRVEVFPGGTAARVIWTTDVPGSSRVEYGLTAFYELGVVEEGILKTNHVLTLTGLQPEQVYHYQIASVDQFGNPISSGDLTFSTRAVTGIISDDFALCGGLNQAVWEWVDPLNDSDYLATGTTFNISVPGGGENSQHNVFTNGNDSARIMQPADDKDFVVQVKFDSRLIENGAMQGIIIEQDEENFMRFDFYRRSDQITVYSAAFTDMTPVYTNNKVRIAADLDSPLYMRITRVGNTWLQEYSFNGKDWVATSNTPFPYELNVNKAGVFAGNFVVGKIVPAHTAVVDYFFNMAAAIEPEDSPYKITTATIGEGSVALAPQRPGYYCGEEVELTAAPDTGWVFAGWNGDVSGFAAQQTVVISGNLTATAIFNQQGTAAFRTQMPMIVRP